MFRPGQVVAEHIRPIRNDQVQPNGVDLTIAEVARPIDAGRIGVDDKTIADRQPVEPSEVTEDRAVWYLPPGGYIVRYGEQLAVPTGHVGFVLPRSSLLRNGCTLETAVWDAGYEGRGTGLLVVHQDIEIEHEARIGQFVLAEAAHEDTYDGSYQGEGLASE